MSMKTINYRILSVLLALLLSACSTAPFPSLQAPVSQNSAVINLRNTALNSAQEGALDHAISTLERALRIEPNNARLWFDLAKMHKQAEDHETANNIALRAASLSNSPWLSANIETFIFTLSL